MQGAKKSAQAKCLEKTGAEQRLQEELAANASQCTQLKTQVASLQMRLRMRTSSRFSHRISRRGRGLNPVKAGFKTKKRECTPRFQIFFRGKSPERRWNFSLHPDEGTPSDIAAAQKRLFWIQEGKIEHRSKGTHITHLLTPQEIAGLKTQVAVVLEANQLEHGQLEARNL